MTQDEAKSALDSILGSMDKGLEPEHRRMLLADGLASLGLLTLG